MSATGASAAEPGTATVHRLTIAALDGKRLASGISAYTPMWSDAEHVYVVDSVRGTVEGTATCTVLQYRKSPSLSFVASSVVGSWRYDTGNPGHRNGSIAVSRSGTVLVHPATHTEPFAMYRSRRPHSIAEWELLPAPSGLVNVSAYRRFFRDPANGELYLLARASQFQACIYHWNEDRQRFDRLDRPNTIPASPGVTDGLNARGTGGYGHELAFATGQAGRSVVYTAPEFTVNSTAGADGTLYQSGFPRRDVSLMRSDDGGHVWRRPSTGAVLDQPFRPVMVDANGTGTTAPTIDVVFPGPAFQPSTPDHQRNNATSARMGVAGGRTPVVVTTWADPREFPDAVEDSDRFRSLWVAAIDPDSGVVTRTKLIEHPVNGHSGSPTLTCSASGLLVVVASDQDDHRRDGRSFIAGESSGVPYPSTASLLVFSTRNGIEWTSLRIDDGSMTGGVSGAYIDPESVDRDGVLRLYPAFPNDPARCEIWTVPLPQLAGTTRRSPVPGPPVARARGGNGTISITWNLPNGDSGSTITGYTVQTSAGPAGPWSAWASMRPDFAGVLDITTPVARTRSYRVSARTAAGATPFSEPVTATTVAEHRSAARPSPAPSHWFRADAITGAGAGSAIGRWPSSVNDYAGLRRDAVTLRPEIRQNAPSSTAADERPRLIADGPDGRPAVRFSRAARSQLVVPATNGTAVRELTVLTVARLNDHAWSTLVSSADDSGRMLRYGPHSRTNHTMHQTRFADAGLDALGAADPVLPWHQVFGDYAHGLRTWRVFVSQWRLRYDGQRRLSGQINRCVGQDLERPSSYSPGDQPGLVTTPDPAARWMTLGATIDLAGSPLSSEADIAEVVRFDRVLTRLEIRGWVDYLCAVHDLPLTNVVPPRTGRPFDPRTETRPCVQDWATGLPHAACTSI